MPVRTLLVWSVLPWIASATVAQDAHPTYEQAAARADATITRVLNAVGAGTAECISDYVGGFEGPARLFCGAVRLDRGKGREARTTITERLERAGFVPDEAVERGRWHAPAGGRFDVRAFVHGFLPVYAVVDVARDRVAFAYPVPPGPTASPRTRGGFLRDCSARFRRSFPNRHGSSGREAG